MGYLGEMEMGEPFQPFAALREQFGFIPNLFRAQTLLPGVIGAETALLAAILFREQALMRIQKELILLAVAAAQRNTACVAHHYQMLRLLAVPESRLDQIMADYQTANLSPENAALVTFALKLGLNASILREDVTVPLALGLTEQSMLEAILITALANFLGTLSTGLGVLPDFAPRQLPPAAPNPAPEANRTSATGRLTGPFLPAPERDPDEFAPFGFLREQFGLVPEVFRAQTLRPEVLEAEVEFIRTVLVSKAPLTRLQKQHILSGETPTILTDADRALFEFVAKLAEQPSMFGRGDVDLLRSQRFTDEQILEAVVITALSHFFSTLERGVGTAVDFPLRRNFRTLEAKKTHLSASAQRHIAVTLFVDPDAECVARAQGGDLDAFEELMNRHSQRVYRTLIGLLGDQEDARDAMQDTFLKAFQHLGGFEGRSKFSTWVVSIASNTGIQRLRERKHLESLDHDFESEEGFRPRQVQSWTDDPEQLYSQTEMRGLIESSVMKLPAKYRVVLMLRDIDQLPVEEAAAALSLSLPAFKARLLRGRLMLREVLAPHFTGRASTGSAMGITS